MVEREQQIRTQQGQEKYPVPDAISTWINETITQPMEGMGEKKINDRVLSPLKVTQWQYRIWAHGMLQEGNTIEEIKFFFTNMLNELHSSE